MIQFSIRAYLFIAIAVIIVMGFVQIYLKYRRGGFHRVAGSNVFGVKWVVESADKGALLKLRPLYEKVRMVENE